ncbi:MAG: RimK family alpha-L-glutamate ligase [Vulcanimicrobiota bacterium]
MGITIFSKNIDSYFNLRLAEEAGKTGISIQLANPFNCILHTDGVEFDGKRIPHGEICIIRTPPYREQKDYIHLLGKILSSTGNRVINPVEAIEITGNKFLTLSRAKTRNIPVLESVAVKNLKNLEQSVSYLGGFPVFLKTIFGTRGIGVIYCPCLETLRASAQAMWAYGANIYIEKFADKSMGTTVRILVFEEFILGGVINRANRNNPVNNHETRRLIRSNFSRGGEIESCPINKEQKEIALGICREIGLCFGGVDLIETHQGWKFLEVNSSPGIKGFEKATGKNIAGDILHILLNRES